MKLIFAFVATVASSAYVAPVVASKASDVAAFSEIVKDTQDKIHLDKKDVTEKPNLRGGQDVDDCLPVGFELMSNRDRRLEGPIDELVGLQALCDVCCSKTCSKYSVRKTFPVVKKEYPYPNIPFVGSGVTCL
eukprot:scaffold85549_cov22-Cyclotella_meneghiniana.AAC.5